MSRLRIPDVDKFKYYSDYLKEIGPKLIEAETFIEEVKGSVEWKRCYGYFQTLYNRGMIKERPTRANGYKVEEGTNMIMLADIEDLLTPDQIEQIKKRL